MKFVKDALYGYVHLSALERQIIDSLPFQRLRYVKQLAMGYLVYPGANHTRFEHSLGSMHLAKEFFEFGTNSADEELILAALLHDVGHGPFSHESECIFAKENLSHETLSKPLITKGRIAELISGSGFSPETVYNYAKGEGKGALITGALGVDRMDYLMRDSYYAGAVYGKVDYERLLRALSISDEGLLLDEKGIEAAESLMLSRFMMFATLYQHKTVAISSAMLRKAMEIAYEKGMLSADQLSGMTDYECLTHLKSCSESAVLINRLMQRALYKPAVYLRSYELPKDLITQLDRGLLSRLEDELCASCSLEPYEIAVHYTYSSYKPINVHLSGEVDSRDLADVSDIVSSIKHASDGKRILFVAVPEEKRNDVEKKALSFIESFSLQQKQHQGMNPD